jgi:hypothetical protein
LPGGDPVERLPLGRDKRFGRHRDNLPLNFPEITGIILIPVRACKKGEALRTTPPISPSPLSIVR